MTIEIMENEERAKQIGRSGLELAQQYLNEQSIVCYLRSLMIEYSKLFSYKPVIHRNAVKIEDLLLSGAAR